MNHKNIENTCHIAGNMEFFEINEILCNKSCWQYFCTLKYDSITEKVHIFILQYYFF